MTDEARALNTTVGRHVRRAILESGSNLRATASRAGLSYRSVLRYISGERDMPVPVLLALVAASDADLIALMTRLQADTHPDPTRQQAGTNPLQVPSTDSAGAGSPARIRAQLHLNQRMESLGVTRLAARSIGPIDTDELLAIADVVQEIVLEFRES